MSKNTTTTADTASYEKGSWQDSLQRSSTLTDRAGKAHKQAGILLWDGATAAITEWLPSADTDRSAESLHAAVESLHTAVLGALGTSRKGDASKIRTVAVAVASNGLVLEDYPNLSKAYAEAVRLTRTVKAERAEDDAAEQAVETIAAEAPKTASSPEAAAKILLSKGLDGAVVAILDALGAKNEAAHRSFIRAVSVEVSARVAANKPKPEPKTPAKAKPAAPKAKGKVNSAAKAKPAKAKPAKVEAPVEVEVEVEAPAKAKPAKAKPVRRAVPVRRSA